MRQRIGERYYGTQHTTSGHPLNRKSVSCPRAYRAFLVTGKAWYQLFAHALNYPKKPDNRILSINSSHCGTVYVHL